MTTKKQGASTMPQTTPTPTNDERGYEGETPEEHTARRERAEAKAQPDPKEPSVDSTGAVTGLGAEVDGYLSEAIKAGREADEIVGSKMFVATVLVGTSIHRSVAAGMQAALARQTIKTLLDMAVHPETTKKIMATGGKIAARLGADLAGKVSVQGPQAGVVASWRRHLESEGMPGGYAGLVKYLTAPKTPPVKKAWGERFTQQIKQAQDKRLLDAHTLGSLLVKGMGEKSFKNFLDLMVSQKPLLELQIKMIDLQSQEKETEKHLASYREQAIALEGRLRAAVTEIKSAQAVIALNKQDAAHRGAESALRDWQGALATLQEHRVAGKAEIATLESKLISLKGERIKVQQQIDTMTSVISSEEETPLGSEDDLDALINQAMSA